MDVFIFYFLVNFVKGNTCSRTWMCFEWHSGLKFRVSLQSTKIANKRTQFSVYWIGLHYTYFSED
jgi:hypothetical protein